jgi:hypothetical protein
MAFSVLLYLANRRLTFSRKHDNLFQRELRIKGDLIRHKRFSGSR